MRRRVDVEEGLKAPRGSRASHLATIFVAKAQETKAQIFFVSDHAH